MKFSVLVRSSLAAMLGLLSFDGFALDVADDAADPRATLNAFTDGLKGLDGRFSQTVFDADGRLTEETTGRVALSAPRQFRWEYEAPFPQLILADGNRVWIYDPELEQVQVRPQGAEEQQSPLTALTDPLELERQFALADGGQNEGVRWIELTPKTPDAPFTSARLGFKQGELAHMETADSLGQRTKIAFTGWKLNPPFSPETFHFTPPEGVDVIGETQDAAVAIPLGD